MSDTVNPTDQPENTGGGTRSVTGPDTSGDSQTATDPPENTGGGTTEPQPEPQPGQ